MDQYRSRPSGSTSHGLEPWTALSRLRPPRLCRGDRGVQVGHCRRTSGVVTTCGVAIHHAYDGGGSDITRLRRNGRGRYRSIPFNDGPTSFCRAGARSRDRSHRMYRFHHRHQRHRTRRRSPIRMASAVGLIIAHESYGSSGAQIRRSHCGSRRARANVAAGNCNIPYARAASCSHVMANTDTDGEPVVASVRHYSALLRLRRAFIETQIPFGYRSALAPIEQHLTGTTTRLIASPHHCLLVVEYPSGSDDTTAYVLGLRKVVPGLIGGRIAS